MAPSIEDGNKKTSIVSKPNTIPTIAFCTADGTSYRNPALPLPQVETQDIPQKANDWMFLMDEDHKPIVFPPQITETAQRPDITIYLAVTKNVIIIELTVPMEENLSNAYARKKGKYKDLELSGGGSSQNNWKGMAISLLVILMVCSLIVTSIVLLTPAEDSNGQQMLVHLEELESPQMLMHDPQASWISAWEVLYRDGDGNIMLLDFQTNETNKLADGSTMALLGVHHFQLSPDRQYLMLACNKTPVFQYSFMATYNLLNLHTRYLRELPAHEESQGMTPLQFAGWGSRGQQLLYIHQNNMYFQHSVESAPVALTSSGREGVLHNGLADWLYEEEILHTHVTHWWSPDGVRLAFAEIDDSLVPQMEIPQYTGSLYPTPHVYRYPKAGQPNPHVQLAVLTLVGLPAEHVVKLQPPAQLRNRDHYFTSVRWVSSTRLAVSWLNRVQNLSLLTLCEATTGACVERYREMSEAWIPRQAVRPVFSADSERFFLPVPVKQGGRGDFQHLAMFTQQESGGQEVRFLTSGSWEVTEVVAYNAQEQNVFFLSAEVSPSHQHLYSVHTTGSYQRHCLSCGLLPNCSFFSAVASPSGRHVILHCLGPAVPSTSVHSLEEPHVWRELEGNKHLRRALASKHLPELHYHDVILDDFVVPVQLRLPAGHSKDNMYPLLYILEDAPGGQATAERFFLDWSVVLGGGSDGAVVARFDARGAGCRGSRFLHALRQRLGTRDTADHAAAIQSLIALPYIDSSRVGIYGKAYGGYLAISTLAALDGAATCVGADSPIFDLALHASAFSERYLGLPTTQAKAYKDAQLAGHLGRLGNAHLLILHGTADEKVHFQHTAELISHLISAGANYSLQVFPDEGHVIRGTSARIRRRRTLLQYFSDCFRPARHPVPQSFASDDDDDDDDRDDGDVDED
uniref:inactive dipeptidyl peptidase 10-like n=1 Tax=Myxine glutinosa TaxID=7769 RepID=UPI00358E9BCC